MMIIKNIGTKIIHIGTTVLMPDQTMRVPDSLGNIPALKLFQSRGMITMTKEERTTAAKTGKAGKNANADKVPETNDQSVVAGESNTDATAE